MVLGQVETDELVGNLEVRFIEVIVDVPSDLTILLSFLDDSVEEGKYIKHWLELRFGAIVHNLIRKLGVGVLDVLTESIWRLSDDLNGFLKDTKWELVSWRSCEPESEVFYWFDVIIDDFKFFEPRDKQVTVLEHDPMTLNRTSFNHLFGLFAHTLTESAIFEFVLSKSSTVDE